MQIGGLGTKGTATLGGTSQIQKSAKKTAENAITDGFVKQIQTLAREDAEKGIYMDTEFGRCGVLVWSSMCHRIALAQCLRSTP